MSLAAQQYDTGSDPQCVSVLYGTLKMEDWFLVFTQGVKSHAFPRNGPIVYIGLYKLNVNALEVSMI